MKFPALLGVVALLFSAAGLSAAGLSDLQTLATVDDPAVHDIHSSDVLAADEDNLCVTWRRSVKGKVDQGDIFSICSADAGKTWSAPALLSGTDATWTNVYCSMFKDAGAFYCFIGMTRTADTHGENEYLHRAMKSTDRGRTWLEMPVKVSYPGPTILGGKIIKVGDRYLQPFHRNDLVEGKFVRVSGVLVSRNLSDWDLAGLIPHSSEPFAAEGYLVVSQRSDRVIQCFMRDCDNVRYRHFPKGVDAPIDLAESGFVYLSESMDGGTTWSTALPYPYIPNYDVKGVVVKDADGRLVTVFCPAPGRASLESRVKPSETAAWSASQPFFDGPGKDQYASMDEYAPGRFYVVWDGGNATTLMFQKLDVR